MLNLKESNFVSPQRPSPEELQELQREALSSERRMYREVARPYIEGALIAGGALLATGTAASCSA